jgi:DNA-binding MarR family transcriptional regulator
MFKLSAKEKLLIYLEDHIDKQLSLRGNPSGIFSQTGMIESVCLPLNQISMALKNLEKAQLVERKRFHVKETGRFRNFYFLTSEGIQKAKELQEEIGRKKIKIREKEKIREMEISDLIKYLRKTAKKSVEMNYTTIIRSITPEGFLDVRTILEPKKYVDYSEKRPEIKYFFGREKELKEIKCFMKSKISKILCIKGIAGIGKTTLLSKFLEDVEMNVFWHRFTEFSTLRSLIIKISEFLSKIDRRKL